MDNDPKEKKTPSQYGLLIEMYSGGVAANRQDMMSMEKLLKRALILMNPYTGCDDLCDDIRAVLDRAENRQITENSSKRELLAPEGVSIH